MKNKTSRSAISAFIICFNEEKFIEDCLRSLDFCDEIIVVDSFSTDRTPEICKKYGVKLIQRKWPGYKEQKAFGLSKCTNHWAFNLDADERVSPELRKSIIEVLENAFEKGNDAVASAYEVNRLIYFLDRWWRKGGWYPELRMRLFQKKDIVWGGQDPHEKPVCSGRVEKLEGDIFHYSYEDFEDQVKRLHKYAKIVAEQEFAAGARSSLLKLLANPLGRFFKFYFFKQGFKEGYAGLIVAILESYYTFLKYVFLWEMEYEAKKASKR